MNDEIKHNVIQVLNYAKDSTSTILEICSPLFKNTNITEFTYCRSFRNGKRLYLCSNTRWLEHYIKEKLYKDKQHLNYYIPQEDVQQALWLGFKMDKVFSACYDLNLCHGFAIYEKKRDYIDLFDFSTVRENNNIINFYINNIDMLRNFIHVFKHKANHLINIPNSNIMMFNDEWIFSERTPSNFLIEPQILKKFEDLIQFKSL